MKFSSLWLYHFQSHLDTLINFHPSINCIVGETDSGKTAILRCLKLIIENKPVGGYYITYGQKTGFGELALANGTIITRGRTGKDNFYKLVLPNQPPQLFKAFGSVIPLDIVEALGLQKITLDDSHDLSVNLANQHDPPFLLTNSGGIKAKAIGKLNGAHIVDISIQDLNKDITTKTSDRKGTLNRVAEIDEELKGFKYLPDLKDKIDRASNLIQQFNEKSGVKENLATSKNRLLSVSNMIAYHQDVLRTYKNIDEAAKTFEKLSNKINLLHTLNKANEKLNSLASHIEELEQKSTDLRSKVEAALPLFSQLQKYTNLWNKLALANGNLTSLATIIYRHRQIISYKPSVYSAYQSLAKLNKLVSDLEALERSAKYIGIRNALIIEKGISMERTKRLLEDKRIELSKLMDELKICPVCYQPINKELVEAQIPLF